MKNNFFDLTEHLRELLKSIPYSDSTYKDMDFIIRSFENYMWSNNLKEYSPELGEAMVAYCENELHVCPSRVDRARIIAAKLNRLHQGLDGNEALWKDQTAEIPLPDALRSALESYLMQSTLALQKKNTRKCFVMDHTRHMSCGTLRQHT